MTKNEKFLLRLSDDLEEFKNDFCNGDLLVKLGFDVFESVSLVKSAIATAFMLSGYDIEEAFKDEE